MDKEYFRTVLQIEVLSQDADFGEGMSLSDIGYAIDEGPCSGSITTVTVEPVMPQTMARLLVAQGSDPGFFMLDEDGNELDE